VDGLLTPVNGSDQKLARSEVKKRPPRFAWHLIEITFRQQQTRPQKVSGEVQRPAPQQLNLHGAPGCGRKTRFPPGLFKENDAKIGLPAEPPAAAPRLT
jgi:hypothetical protein